MLQRRNSGGRHLLHSSFTARIGLASPLPSLEQRMRSNPLLKQLSYGTMLRYLVADIDIGDGGFPVLEVYKNRIVYSFAYPSGPGRGIYASNLLKFFSLLSYAGDIVAVDMGSLYPYIIDSLSGYIPSVGSKGCQGDCNFRWVESRMRSAASANLYLSNLSLNLMSLIDSAEGKALHYRRLYHELLYAASAEKSAAGAARFISSLGVDAAEHKAEAERLFSGASGEVGR